MSTSNYHLTHKTTRPPIIFEYERRPRLQPGVDKQLFRDVFGSEPRPAWMEFRREHMTRGTREHRMLLKTIKPEAWDELTALRLLRRAATSRKNADLIEASKRLLTKYPKNFDVVRGFNSPAQIMELYANLLSERIEGARLAVESKGMDPRIVIRCPNMRTAAFVYASFGGLEICQGCGKLFAPNPERMSQLYCSSNCGQRVYQRAFRKRQKNAKKGR